MTPNAPLPSAVKYKTVVFDSAGEWARLLFSWDMKKGPAELEKIRGPNNYPGMTERLNIQIRRLKTFRAKGANVVIIAHEDIQKVYGRGSMIAGKGQISEPIAVRGWLDIPGNTAPQEVERAADNIFRVRLVNGAVTWVANQESIGPGADEWEVKDRFGARSFKGGLLPPDYNAIREHFKNTPNWSDNMIWIIYGKPGLWKTRSVAQTFPDPIKWFDFDLGTQSIRDIQQSKHIDIIPFDVEDFKEYEKFLKEMEATLGQL